MPRVQGRFASAESATTADTVPDELIDSVLDASRALVALSARSIAESSGVTLPQYRMLVVLDAGPVNLSGLASTLDVAASTALRMVDRLVDAGMVDRQTHPEDRRNLQLSLTATGRRTVRRVTNRRRRDIATVLARIDDPRRRDAVARALADFALAAHAVTAPGTDH